MVDVKDNVKEKRVQKYETGAIVFDELPPAPVRGGGGGKSEFIGILEDLHGDPHKVGKPVSVRRYENESAAKAASNVLRQRYGRSPNATGHDFQVRALDDGKGGVTRWHLFITWDPSKIVDGAYEQHVESERVRVGKIEARRLEKQAESNGSEEVE